MIPIKAPEFANAYLIQPSAPVPKVLPLFVTDVVTAPVLVIPVTAVAVPEVAKPRIVLVLMLRVVPVALFLIPTIAAVPPEVDVNVPTFDRLPPDRE